MPRGILDPETRRRVTSAGGRARAAAMPADERERMARAGAAAVNSPAGLARRLVKAWRDLSSDERAEVDAILAERGAS